MHSPGTNEIWSDFIICGHCSCTLINNFLLSILNNQYLSCGSRSCWFKRTRLKFSPTMDAARLETACFMPHNIRFAAAILKLSYTKRVKRKKIMVLFLLQRRDCAKVCRNILLPKLLFKIRKCKSFPFRHNFRGLNTVQTIWYQRSLSYDLQWKCC